VRESLSSERVLQPIATITTTPNKAALMRANVRTRMAAQRDVRAPNFHNQRMSNSDILTLKFLIQRIMKEHLAALRCLVKIVSSKLKTTIL
jgi:hypothetical protein